MQELKDRIVKEGKVLPGNIIKVDGFLNHRIDTELMDHIAEEFGKHFNMDEVSLILTAEAKQYYLQSKREYEARQHQAQIAGSVGPQPDSRPLTPEARAMLAEGEAYIAKIRLSNEAIPDAEITRKIDQIEHVVRTIFQRVEERPEAANELGQLMDYYLPTTAKLLDAYRDLDSQPIQGQNIQKSKREISGALDALAVAFEKLLDQVFQEMAWDVSSDVAVLRTVLAQEGLTQNPFEKRS